MSAARAAVLLAATAAIACGVEQSDSGHVEESEVNELARRYVSVVLAIGQHDPDYVDAYYGPEELRPTGSKRPLAEIDRDAASIEAALKAGAGESAAEGDPGNDLLKVMLAASAAHAPAAAINNPTANFIEPPQRS